MAATILSPAAAFAQAAPADDKAANAPQDIIVTARKTSEKLQDVPVAITAFTADDIKAAKIERLSDIAKLTPGLNFTPLFGAQNQLPIIRGAAQTFGQLNVGVFLDGIYLSGKAGVDLELNDLERVEVVKGPQSALYGRNTFAGAINYVTKRPTADLTANAEFTGGTNGLVKGVASISGPLSDTLRFRVGGFFRQFDGFYTSSIDGGKVDFAQNYGGIGTLEWKPDEAFTATLRFSYSKENNGQPPSSIVRTNAAPGIPAGGSATQPRNLLYIGEVPAIPRNGVTVNTRSSPGLPGGSYGDREESIRGSADLEYDFGPVTLTSITAYAKRNAEYTFDGDNTICDRTGGCPSFGFPFAPAIPIGSSAFSLSSNKGYYRDISQEIRLASSGKQVIDWLVGFYYYDNINVGVDRGFSPTTTAGPTAYSAFNPNYSYPLVRLTTKSYSGFGSASWHATDKFTISGEVRYESESQSFAQCPTYYANPSATPPAGVVGCGATPSPIVTSAANPFTGAVTVFPSPAGTAAATAFTATNQTFSFVTPRAILSYKVDPDALVYASYARGAKTGGFNTGLNVFANQRAYQPETTNNYEVGLKSRLFDRQLLFNVAGYYTDWNNQQAVCQNPVSAGGSSTNRSYTCNVAAATIYGIEVETAYRFNDVFSVVGNYAWTHARYDRFVDDSLAQNLTLAGLPPINFNGKSLPYVPEHKFLISPRIDVPTTGDIKLQARADIVYQSKTFVRADNLQNFGDKATVDFRVTATNGAWRLQFFVDNAFDDASPVAGVRFFDTTNYFVSAPLVQGAQRRQFGVSLGYNF
ncbi:TonB-dependent receptor [Sphingomonas sp. 28-63-12]|uniref:TonB-dependent receptor n=1 Tax=Sphingomonas sp. 28-63-12 TaxID=1970434 RepID=UPI0035A98CD0